MVAIKKVEIDDSRRSRSKKYVVREAAILRRLDHPHIVACEEYFLDKEVLSELLFICVGHIWHMALWFNILLFNTLAGEINSHCIGVLWRWDYARHRQECKGAKNTLSGGEGKFEMLE